MSATKRLAKELGFIRKGASWIESASKDKLRSKNLPLVIKESKMLENVGYTTRQRTSFMWTNSSGIQHGVSHCWELASGQPAQTFSHLIVLDFEATCWESKRTNRENEIIEFPAVLLNTTSGKIEAEFQSYVKPSENPKLSPFCTNLTGISQEQVDEGFPLASCLKMFDSWVKDLQVTNKFVFSTDSRDALENLYPYLCTFLTWSDWDLGRCLPNECFRKKLQYPSYLKQWIDLRATYKSFYARKPRGVSGSLEDVGLAFTGRQHSGLDDARNTAHLAGRMIQDGCIFNRSNVTKKYFRKFSPIASNRTKQQSRLPTKEESRGPGLTDSVVTAGKVIANLTTELSSSAQFPLAQQAPLSTTQTISKSKFDKESMVPYFLEDSELNLNLISRIVEENPLSVLEDQVSDNAKNLDRILLTKMPDSVPCSTQSATGETELEIGTRFSADIPLEKSGSMFALLNDSAKAGVCKTITPPFCQCGRRAKRRLVQKVGPNRGRAFFCCGQVKDIGKCKYFQWESQLSTVKQTFIKTYPKAKD